MAVNKIKRIGVPVVVLLLLALGFVVADYFAAFGTTEVAKRDFIEFYARTVDAETGRKIGGVHVTCFQYGTNSACTQPSSRKHGEVRIQILAKKNIRSTYLFTKDVWYSPVLESELRIMYIHPDYKKPVQRFQVSELIEKPGQIFTVEMAPLDSSAAGNEANGDPDS